MLLHIICPKIDYWDSYWIIEGLIKSELFSVAQDTLQNFMDELDTLGFIPNGGRIYCESIRIPYFATAF